MTAVKARLPLIGVETDDPMHLRLIFDHLLGETVFSIVEPSTVLSKVPEDCPPVLIVEGESTAKLGASWRKVYTTMANRGCTMVVVNPLVWGPELFNAGTLPVPDAVVTGLLKNSVKADKLPAIAKSLRGLSIKSAMEVCRMVSSDSGSITPKYVRAMRRRLFHRVRGIELLDPDVPVFMPYKELVDWLSVQGKLLTADHKLAPRGLMLVGPPGTGKTLTARYLSKKLDLPAYRLDMSTVMDKYTGESEHNLKAALEAAEECSPCLLLLDEAEKLFTTNTEGEASKRCLALLLWWMQEHKSKVMVIMTSNDHKSIPPELLRPGRIDAVFTLKGLTGKQANVLLDGLKKHYADLIPENWDFFYPDSGQIFTQASVTNDFLSKLMKSISNNLTNQTD